MDIDFLVRVDCMTYNHAPYIEDAMNGFCMQETMFPFVCTIVDDASTDGEQEVIRKYLEEHFDLQDKLFVRNEETDDYLLTFARHKTNHNCFFAVMFLKYNHYQKKSKASYIKEWSNTKYIAICEGDDFWIDPLKLQKQVEGLENNPQATLCYTGYYTVDDKGKESPRPYYEWNMSVSHSGNNMPSLFKCNYIMTLTICLRTEVYSSELYKQAPYKIDFGIFMAAAFMGNFIYLPEKTGSYRKNPTSLTQTAPTAVSKRLKYLNLYYAEKYVFGFYRIPLSYKDSLLTSARVTIWLLKGHAYSHICRLFLMNLLTSPLIVALIVYELISNHLLIEKLGTNV